MNINPEEQSDGELVALSLKDSKNYRYLIEKYSFRLRLYIQRISGFSTEDVEDILQEVFISVYRNLNGYSSMYKFSSWIYRIAHNATISFFRKNKKNYGVLDLEDNDLGERLSSGLNLEDKINIEYVLEELVKALSTLDLKYKSALILKYIEGKDYSEISDILKIPTGTVGTFIKRGKEILLKKLKKHL